MLKRFSRLIMMLIGMSLGGGLAHVAMLLLSQFNIIGESSVYWNLVTIIVNIAGVLLGLLIAVILHNPLMRNIQKTLRVWERIMARTPVDDIFFGSIGLVLGLVIAFLITRIFSDLIFLLSLPLSVLVYVVLAYLGFSTGFKRWKEMPLFRRLVEKEKAMPPADGACPKVLDTSAIIDGRIYDLSLTGFLEGRLIIADFVLTELRHIADSPDELRRNRGRRGLDILSKLQKDKALTVELVQTDLSDDEEVDTRLLKLAQKLGGKVVTNDYNLNKVGEVTGTGILNINQLANALKPALLPGEEMTVQIVKEGKEAGQGVAYLNDGTMIVVDNGRRHMGKNVAVSVTSVLQTAAGRMIFAKAAMGSAE